MDNNASPSQEPDTTARRRSGRVVKAPAKFTPEPASQPSTKRKRHEDDEEDVENQSPASDEEMSDDLDDDSDDDHPAPRSRNKASQPSRAKKPSSKKPKINGSQPARAAQHVGLVSRPKKTVRIDAGDQGTGLFGKCYLPSPLQDCVLTWV